MAIKPLTTPYVMKAATLLVAEDDYTAHVSGVLFTPSTQSATWRGIGGNVVKDQSVADWSCRTDIIQDADEEGLHRYFLEHEGEVKAVVFTPTDGGDPVYATIVVAAPEIGGAADAFPTASVTHAVQGKPSYTPPTAP